MANKRINLEADFPTKTASNIITEAVKFIGAGSAGDARADADAILHAGLGLNETEIQALIDKNLRGTYRISDVDLTVAAASSVLLRTGKTFIVTEVVVWHKTVVNWTVASAGDVRIGFANASDISGTMNDWDDSFCDNTSQFTSSFQLAGQDLIERVSTGYDSIGIVVDVARTADNLVGDVFISGFEFTT